jgi:hypothetical protein
MVWTLVGYSESQDSATLVNIAALADPHVRVEGDNIIIPTDVRQLVGYYALGPNATRARLVSPTLRRISNIEIKPLDQAAEPTIVPFVHDLRRTPIALDPADFLTAEMAEDAACAASRVTVLVWLADAPIEPIAGDMRSVRVTNATTLVASTWVNGALTFAEQLPAGRYAVVGAHFIGAGLQAFRFVFPGGTWRPGGLGFDDDGDQVAPMFRYGAMGSWGEFEHDAPPTVDFLSISADTSQVGTIDIIQVRAGRP